MNRFSFRFFLVILVLTNVTSASASFTECALAINQGTHQPSARFDSPPLPFFVTTGDWDSRSSGSAEIQDFRAKALLVTDLQKKVDQALAAKRNDSDFNTNDYKSDPAIRNAIRTAIGFPQYINNQLNEYVEAYINNVLDTHKRMRNSATNSIPSDRPRDGLRDAVNLMPLGGTASSPGPTLGSLEQSARLNTREFYDAEHRASSSSPNLNVFLEDNQGRLRTCPFPVERRSEAFEIVTSDVKSGPRDDFYLGVDVNEHGSYQLRSLGGGNGRATNVTLKQSAQLSKSRSRTNPSTGNLEREVRCSTLDNDKKQALASYIKKRLFGQKLNPDDPEDASSRPRALNAADKNQIKTQCNDFFSYLGDTDLVNFGSDQSAPGAPTRRSGPTNQRGT
ncbi:MAG: hypothetical protein AB7F43_06260 [Bacteriovoracia bacterium]